MAYILQRRTAAGNLRISEIFKEKEIPRWKTILDGKC